MSTIDIREHQSESPNKIVFSDHKNSYGDPIAYCLKSEDGGMVIDDSCDHLYIEDRLHAENLIKALQKAIDLGWLK